MTRARPAGMLATLESCIPHPKGLWPHVVALCSGSSSGGNQRVSEHGERPNDSTEDREEVLATGGPDMHASAVGVNVLLERGASQTAVVNELTAHGLRVEQVLGRINVVSGNVDPSRLQELSEVMGVEAVELDRPISAADRRRQPRAG
jgi:hypothetical protein